MHVYSLVYTSRAAVPVTGDLLVDILVSSRVRNETTDVTGHLLYTTGSFLQELEGPQDAVEETYARIVLDHRHEDVTLLGRGRQDHRDFPSWTMSMVRFAASQLVAFGVAGADLRSFDPTDGAYRDHVLDGMRSLDLAKELLRGGPPETGRAPARPEDAGWMFLRA